MRYDASKPVTIHNPYPAKKWPFRRGQKVLYIVTRGVVGAPWIAKGRVRWYQPALHDDCVVTKGQPTLTMDVLAGSDFGSAQIEGVENVFPCTKDGMIAALKRILVLREIEVEVPNV